MGVALITAGGVVLAALVGIVISLIQANERTSRLLREAETLAKLQPGTTAHKLMERHMELAIVRYSEDAKDRWYSFDVRAALWPLLQLYALLVWLYIGTTFDVHSWAWIYSAVLVQLAIVWLYTIVKALWGMLRDLYKFLMRKRNNAQDE